MSSEGPVVGDLSDVTSQARVQKGQRHIDDYKIQEHLRENGKLRKQYSASCVTSQSPVGCHKRHRWRFWARHSDEQA